MHRFAPSSLGNPFLLRFLSLSKWNHRHTLWTCNRITRHCFPNNSPTTYLAFGVASSRPPFAPCPGKRTSIASEYNITTIYCSSNKVGVCLSEYVCVDTITEDISLLRMRKQSKYSYTTPLIGSFVFFYPIHWATTFPNHHQRYLSIRETAKNYSGHSF